MLMQEKAEQVRQHTNLLYPLGQTIRYTFTSIFTWMLLPCQVQERANERMAAVRMKQQEQSGK